MDIMSQAPVFSALEAEAFTPPRSPRTYHLAPLSYRERNAMRREMRRAGGDRPDRAVMLAVMREALRQIAPANLDDALAQIDEAEAAPDDMAAQARLAVLERAVSTVPAYAELVESRIRYQEAWPWVSVRFALRGWEGPGLPPFTRVGGLVPESLLDAIPAAELEVVAARADELIWLGPSAEGNSEAPSPLPENQAPTPEG